MSKSFVSVTSKVMAVTGICVSSTFPLANSALSRSCEPKSWQLVSEAVLIAGPTASGKSAAALALADRLGGRIINADSMQVYRELPVLTAQPSAADMADIPHRLYSTVSGREAYSVGRWVADAAAEIRDARSAGQVPILVGGSGLYFMALLPTDVGISVSTLRQRKRESRILTMLDSRFLIGG